MPQQKTKNKLILPLTNLAGNVLIKYLKKSRPNNLPYRELFLKFRAPKGKLKPTGVNGIFQRRVRYSGLDIACQGVYCLRHSYAVHLLRQGTSLKTIGDLLGHRTAESTCVYLRLNIEDLRSVALPVPQNKILTTALNPILTSKYRPNTKRLRKISNTSGTLFRSFVAKQIKNYLQLKRSLGRNYRQVSWVLHSLDAFIINHYPLAKNLTAEMFNQWSLQLSHLSPTTRRARMLSVRRFCLYRSRSHPHSFIPDPLTFPTKDPPIIPYIFSESDIVRILNALQYLPPHKRCSIRPQIIRMAVILLYTAGLRRGELLRLKLCDYNSTEKTLFIKEGKFHKSRIIPLSPSVATELHSFLQLRAKKHLPMDVTSPLIWSENSRPKKKEYSGKYTGTGFYRVWIAVCAAAGILTKEGRPPRLHDLRHSFAINVLQQWYQTGENVQAKLPLLSRFMGHVSIESTFYYLSFVEGIRSEASARFQKSFGSVISPNA